MDTAPTPKRSSVPEFLRRLADQLRAREDELGRPLDDGADPEDIEVLAKHFEEVINEGEERGGVTPTDTWALYQHMAFISRAWLFPEDDPLAERIVNFLEETRFDLGQIMDKQLPETADQRKQWEDLTALEHAARRTEKTRLNENRKPSILSRLFGRR